MREIVDKIATIFNGITPILVIIFLILTHGNYVNQHEYEQVKNQIFVRLDNVEALIYKILNDKTFNEPVSK